MKEGLYNSIFQYSKIVLASVRLGMILLKAFFARNVSCSTIGIELHMQYYYECGGQVKIAFLVF